MNLQFDVSLARGYKNPAQIARVLTEQWVGQHGFCIPCGNSGLQRFKQNLPAADFYCEQCHAQFELKSQQGKQLAQRINDGAYQRLVERICSHDNPHFFFLSYLKSSYLVQQFVFIPKHFFNVSMINARKPLPSTARRAGWIGCTIDIAQIPESGKIYLVNQGQVQNRNHAIHQYRSYLFLNAQSLVQKGWTLKVLQCIEHLPQHFNLQQLYQFEPQLAPLFPDNQHIRAKLRQQLQILRDQGIITFCGKGQYKKINC